MRANRYELWYLPLEAYDLGPDVRADVSVEGVAIQAHGVLDDIRHLPGIDPLLPMLDPQIRPSLTRTGCVAVSATQEAPNRTLGILVAHPSFDSRVADVFGSRAGLPNPTDGVLNPWLLAAWKRLRAEAATRGFVGLICRFEQGRSRSHHLPPGFRPLRSQYPPQTLA